MGLVPSSGTIGSGTTTIGFNKVLPGAPIQEGYNYLLGFGLDDQFEIVGRLATNDLKCVTFFPGKCPSGLIRDVSASFKYKLPLINLKNNYGVDIAVGATDIGGAATYFRSYYTVAEKQFRNTSLVVGYAKSQVQTSVLDGSLASLTWDFTEKAKFNLQVIGSERLVSASYDLPLGDNGLKLNVSYTKNIGQIGQIPGDWLSLGINFPLDVPRVRADLRKNHSGSHSDQLIEFQKSELLGVLSRHGFEDVKVGMVLDLAYVLDVSSNSFDWNVLDGMGLATGLFIGTVPDVENRDFLLIYRKNGIFVKALKADIKCLRSWYSGGEACQLKFLSMMEVSDILAQNLEWVQKQKDGFKIDLELKPVVYSYVGADFGAFDADLGLSSTFNIPVWRGASLDLQHINRLDINTRGFEFTGLYYFDRIEERLERVVVKQILEFPKLNSYVQISAGTIMGNWSGWSYESFTPFLNGQQRLSLNRGSYVYNAPWGRLARDYGNIKYRAGYGENNDKSIEITVGKFWNQDKGYKIRKSYWYGDVELALNFRRTRFNDQAPWVSFAGFEISMPLSMRHAPGWSNFSVRGADQWSYGLESKVLESDNRITGGFGIEPDTGKGLKRFLNRDRMSDNYFDSQSWRLRDAYRELILR